MDRRLLSEGCEIPSECYSDQPYIMKNLDGTWVCVMTTGKGLEGESGQHIVSLRSSDKGATWSAPVDVEPADGPESSYAVALATPKGRIFCFYNHNTDNLREVDADDPPYKDGKCKRVDSLGHYVFRYSDDGGRSWSSKRYEIPVRETEIDRDNIYGGRIRFFWNVGRPFIRHRWAYVPLHKVGGFGEGFFTSSEGVFLMSRNLLTEDDPEKIRWETLPEGEIGLRSPVGGGPIAEEHSAVVLSDGSIYCVYRTIDGRPTFSVSRDGGFTWTAPQYQTYADGSFMKHPRAANFVWRCQNGKYLYWFHNHGGKWYDDRNPVWLCGGVEADGPDGKIIRWSQPEIVLYDDDTFIRMSYPDLIEDDGRYYLTETQKDIARVHSISAELLDGLWGQFDDGRKTTDGLCLEFSCAEPSNEIPCPVLPAFQTSDRTRADFGTRDLRNGFAIEAIFQLGQDASDEGLVSNRDLQGHGFELKALSDGRLEITLDDGRTRNSWDTWPSVAARGQIQHLVIIVDGGPKIILFVHNGELLDGGHQRQFGWGRFSPNLRDVNGNRNLCIKSFNQGSGVKELRIYKRAISVSEAVGNYKASMRYTE